MKIYQHDDAEGNTWYILYRMDGRYWPSDATGPAEYPVSIIECVALNRIDGRDVKGVLRGAFLERLHDLIEAAEQAFVSLDYGHGEEDYDG